MNQNFEEPDDWKGLAWDKVIEARNDERRKTIEECAKIADAYAEENQRMAGDTILLDPVLSGGRLTHENAEQAKNLMVEGCIHSSMYHAANNIAEAIRALAVTSKERETR